MLKAALVKRVEAVALAVVADGVVYVYDVFTSPECRGRNIAPAVSSYRLRYLRQAGFRQTVGVIVPENRASNQAFQKTGFSVLGRMGYIKFGPWRRDFCQGDASSVLRAHSRTRRDLRQ